VTLGPWEDLIVLNCFARFRGPAFGGVPKRSHAGGWALFGLEAHANAYRSTRRSRTRHAQRMNEIRVRRLIASSGMWNMAGYTTGRMRERFGCVAKFCPTSPQRRVAVLLVTLRREGCTSHVVDIALGVDDLGSTTRFTIWNTKATSTIPTTYVTFRHAHLQTRASTTGVPVPDSPLGYA